MNALKSMTGIVVAVTVAAGSGCAGDPTGPSNQVKVYFTGTVTGVSDPDLNLDGRIAVGQTVVGHYMYDMSAVDLQPDRTDHGSYRHITSPYGISFTVNGLTFETDPTNVDFRIAIHDNSRVFGDLFSVRSYNNRLRNGGLKVGGIGWTLADGTLTALSSTALSASPPDLADWEWNRLEVQGGSSNPSAYTWYRVEVHVTGILRIGF